MRCFAVSAALLLLLSAFGTAPSAAAETPLLDAATAGALQDRDYPAALKAIAAAAAVKGAPLAELAYLKAWTLCLNKDYDAAAAACDELIKQFPGSPLAPRARFVKGQALARKGAFSAAAVIYRSQADRLLDPARQCRLADIYVEFATAAHHPPQGSLTPPDFGRALQFYLQALQVQTDPRRQAELNLAAGDCLQNTQQYQEAAKRYQEIITAATDRPAAGPTALPADRSAELEARYRLGQCQLALGELPAARRTWQDMLAGDLQSTSPRTAEAAFHLAETWKLPEPANNTDLDLGIAALESFLERYPAHALAGEARLLIARTYVKRRRNAEAAGVLTRFLADPRMQAHKKAAAAEELLGDACQGQRKFAEALAAWHKLLANHPAYERQHAVQAKIVKAEYELGLERYRAGDEAAATKLLSEFMVRYPLHENNAAILLLMGQIEFRHQRWEAAIAQWRRLVAMSESQQSSGAGEAQYLIAATLEDKLGRPADALREYEKVTSGAMAMRARLAAQRLQSQELELAALRVFRSGETPRLRLVTRNLESVKLRLYKVDLETYFRKVHGIGGLAQLDISLIDPDATIQYKVHGYAKYVRCQNMVDVHLPEGLHCGTMAVTVSGGDSEARGAQLEAATLLIQSDLDVIVKSSPDELLVLAENMRTGKPWPGARLIFSDGQEVFAEAAAGADGLWQQSYPALKKTSNLRVFAVAEGHVASNALELGGTPAQRPADRGYLDTDRWAYRPGDVVQLRGCLRRATTAGYVVDAGKTLSLDVLDPRGRRLAQQEVKLDPFGTFQATVALPAECPQGQYRVTAVHADEHLLVSGSFQVRQYKLIPVRLTVDTPRRVYTRGESIEGTIRAASFYGSPLAGREIRYQIEGQRSYTARTDARGEAPLKLPTRELGESQVLTVVVSLPELDVTQAVHFTLAPQDLALQVSTPRPVYLAGETAQVAVKATDARGQPLAVPLVLKVVQLMETAGPLEPSGLRGEQLLEERPLSTAVDGTASTGVKLDKAGHYRLRVEGLDRFKTRVTAETPLEISGADDQIRLRILTDRGTFRVGDTAQVRLLWREAPAIGLLTLDGGRILRRQLVELQTGVNTLALPIGPELAPNFDLTVAAMSDVRPADPAQPIVAGRRFHTASTPLEAQQELRVGLEWKRKGDSRPRPTAVRPGDQLELTVTTSDVQGRPVPAELSVGLVQKSLLDQKVDTRGSMAEVFRGPQRKSVFRTASSITYTDAAVADDRATRSVQPTEPVALEDLLTALIPMGEPCGVVPPDPDSDPFAERAARPVSRSTPHRTTNNPPANNPAAAQDDPPPAATASAGAAEQLTGMLHGRQDAQNSSAPAAADDQWDWADTPSLREFELQESAYWNGAVVTGADGRAQLTLNVPDAATTWALVAKGITHESLAGEAMAALTARKLLTGELKLPLAFTDGDRADVVARVHNAAAGSHGIDVTLRTSIGPRTITQQKTLAAAGPGILEAVFPLELKSEGTTAATQAVFELIVACGDARDVVRRSVPLQPFGRPVYASAGGAASSDTTVWLEAPAEVAAAARRLQVFIGPSVEQSLLDVVLADPPAPQAATQRLASGVEATVADLMAACALQRLVATTRAAAGPQAVALDARIRSALTLLVSLQAESGGWGWTESSEQWQQRGGEALFQAGAPLFEPRDEAQPITTARVAWALALAGAAGYAVPDTVLAKSRAYLQGALARTSSTDSDTKAVVLHALALQGDGDFSLANHLYRDRPALSPLALVHLALAFAEMDRKATAAELLDLLARRNLDEPGPCGTPGGSPAELRALYALAAQQAAPRSPKTRELIDWLLAHRSGYRWSPDAATGPATLALARWFGENRFAGERYALAVSVNGTAAATVEVDHPATTVTLDIPSRMLAPGKQRIAFQLTGRGRYVYQCVLGGLVPADKLRSHTDRWTIARYYEPAQRELDGRSLARGFTCIQGSYRGFRNPLEQLAVGHRGLVTLHVRRAPPADAAAAVPEYLVVSEPLPAGAGVIEHSVRGGFERYEIDPGAITFYVGNRRTIEPIRYELYGFLSGAYRAAPSVACNAQRPEQAAVAAVKSLEVLPAGAASRDAYRLTPDELLALGTAAHKRHDMPTAAGHLSELLEKWNLGPAAYRSAVEMLLDAHLELGPPEKIVHYFEIVKEHWPEAEIPFDKILRIGAAYQALGEHERSYLVYRATVESSFVRDSGVAGFLESQNEFLRSVDVLQRLLGEYPPEPYVAAARFALSQQVYAKAPQAAEDEKLRQAGVKPAQLLERAWRMLEGLLCEHPDDPAADQAAFSAANALLDLKRNAEAGAACQRYARRYARSPLLDTFWYVIGYADFATGRAQEALQMCQQVAEARIPDPATGRLVESRNKWRAIYIRGQIYHSLGQPAEAIGQYRLVEDRFPDARQSIAAFLRQSIQLPEVTTLRITEPAAVELKYANVPECDLKVYRIDLLKFSQIQRDLGRIAEINLAGIRPYYQTTVKLGDGRDYRPRQKRLELPLKKEGAYLVVCRGENQYASGLALLTPLVIEVHEEPESALVRTTVRDALTDRCVAGVQVKVVGQGNDQPLSGTTDLRGVFTAEGVRGAATVIALSEPSRYAFYRSPLAPPSQVARREAPRSGPSGRARNQPAPVRDEARLNELTRDDRGTHLSVSASQVAEGAAERSLSEGIYHSTPAEDRIREQLHSDTSMEFINTPLTDVVEYLKDLHGIEIQLDKKKLEEIGVQLDAPITRSLKGVSLGSALKLILHELDLAYIVSDSVLLITTREAADANLRTVVYPVADLVLPGGAAAADASGEGGQADFDSLIDLITSTVKPTSWDAVGGPGSIAPHDNTLTLVFSQTEEVHEQVRELLDQLRKAKGLAGPIRLPVRRREPSTGGGMGGGFGGMGGGGAFGGGVNANKDENPDTRPAGQPAPGKRGKAQSEEADNDLLGGLRFSNSVQQKQKGDELKRTYKRGMDMNGGMGGGVGAGGAF